MNRLPRIACSSDHASPVVLLGCQDAGGQNVYVDEVSRNLGRLGYAVDVFMRRDNAEARAHQFVVQELMVMPMTETSWP